MNPTSTSQTPSPASKAARLYVIVRGDLPPGLLLAQTAHVARKFTRRFPDVGVSRGEDEISRVDEDENLIVLSTPDEASLLHLEELLEWEVPLASIETFREPDLDDTLTALAVHGGVTPETALRLGQLLSGLSLALRDPEKATRQRGGKADREDPDPDPNPVRLSACPPSAPSIFPCRSDTPTG